jgi:hypothetical protein
VVLFVLDISGSMLDRAASIGQQAAILTQAVIVTAGVAGGAVLASSMFAASNPLGWVIALAGTPVAGYFGYVAVDKLSRTRIDKAKLGIRRVILGEDKHRQLDCAGLVVFNEMATMACPIANLTPSHKQHILDTLEKSTPNRSAGATSACHELDHGLYVVAHGRVCPCVRVCGLSAVLLCSMRCPSPSINSPPSFGSVKSCSLTRQCQRGWWC